MAAAGMANFASLGGYPGGEVPMKASLPAVIVVYALTLSLASAATNAPKSAATNAVPDIVQVDKMSGVAFEKLVKQLLEKQGYEVGKLRESNDYGVDLIANKDKVRIAVQVKRSKNRITRKAISDAVAGMKYYKCTKAMVVTNSEFTEDAREFGRGTECTLVDRKILLEWLGAAKQATERAATDNTEKKP